jgi:hypothetical protein
MNYNIKNINRLIANIKSIANNRSSLSDEDYIILLNVIRELRKIKREIQKSGNFNLDKVIKIVELLLKFFVISHEALKLIMLFK